MKRTITAIATAGVVTVPLLVGFAGPASASPGGAPANASCVQAGIGFLRDHGLLQAAAQKQIDYSLLGPDAVGSPYQGLIAPQLPAGSFLSLGQVVKLHTTHPEYFPNWC